MRISRQGLSFSYVTVNGVSHVCPSGNAHRISQSEGSGWFGFSKNHAPSSVSVQGGLTS